MSNELEKIALTYVQQVTVDISATTEIVAQLKHHLSDQEIVELTFTVALANLTNRFNVALGNQIP